MREEFAHYAAFKGSIALNGISLTIAELQPASFVVWIIPHTRRLTNLAEVQPNDLLNIEFDLIAKYIERMLPPTLIENRPLLRPETKKDGRDRPEQDSQIQA